VLRRNYDNDGYDDWLSLIGAASSSINNNGDGTFTDVTEGAGCCKTANPLGHRCSFLDYDRDGHLDLFVANYVTFDPARAPQPGSNSTADILVYPPVAAAGLAAVQPPVSNRGDGTFEDVSERSV